MIGNTQTYTNWLISDFSYCFGKPAEKLCLVRTARNTHRGVARNAPEMLDFHPNRGYISDIKPLPLPFFGWKYSIDINRLVSDTSGEISTIACMYLNVFKDGIVNRFWSYHSRAITRNIPFSDLTTWVSPPPCGHVPACHLWHQWVDPTAVCFCLKNSTGHESKLGIFSAKKRSKMYIINENI